MNKYYSLFCVVGFLIFLGCKSIEPTIGEYYIENSDLNGFLVLNKDKSYNFFIKKGLYNQESQGKWFFSNGQVFLRSKFQPDTFQIEKYADEKIEGVLIKVNDFNNTPIPADVIIDNAVRYKLDSGNLNYKTSDWNKIDVLYFHHNSGKVDTVTVYNDQSNINYINVKVYNDLANPNYLFFDDQKIDVKKDKLIMPSDSLLPKLVFKRKH